MYREAWRLQREFFWNQDMSKVDWDKVFQRYQPVLSRVGTRAEFSDLMWEMQGELGTSHSYEIGGDYRPSPQYNIGLLGADVEYDPSEKAYRIKNIVKGDPWEEKNSSPFLRPGVNVKKGDFICKISGRQVEKNIPLNQYLLHQAGNEVALEVRSPGEKETRQVTLKTLRTEMSARYRDWVEKNRNWVHETSKGKIGYMHIPNMGPLGFSEFHRYFMAEMDYDGLIIDVRFNGGGHVSQLLLSKLARKRIAYVKSRWFGDQPYPDESVAGPMVALTNELAGSDGDIFSHCFKYMKLGPLIGKRTWGGVVGIHPRHFLVDGSMTTQPEFSFWFTDVGWKIENFGAEPDIDVDISPQDYAQGKDPQMERGLKEILDLIKIKPRQRPDFSNPPDLSLPT